MTTTEEKLLKALALMAYQYLTDRQTGVLDSLHMTAGEWALEALEEHGLVDCSEYGLRGGVWTEAGTRLIEST